MNASHSTADGFAAYLAAVGADLARGMATEHTHRPALKTLIEAQEQGLIATNEPSRIECGAPDFIVTRRDLPVGYIEAKDVGTSLDDAERSEQLGRYRDSLSNLILTDYLEFRRYRDGDFVDKARLGHLDSRSGRVHLDHEADKVASMLVDFLAAEPPRVTRPEELAKRMAGLARSIRDIIGKALVQEREGGSPLRDQLAGFRRVLIHRLKEPEFADMYAQTIAYGLFAARVNAPEVGQFTREHAAYDLPKTNPFLRQTFGHIAGPNLDDRISWAVDDLAELLNRAAMDAILEDFGRRTRREDPVVHFYETFLASYNPRMRESRGVYYTPEPVVRFIVRSIDGLLRSDFALQDGLADRGTVTLEASDGEQAAVIHRVQILDPACGTGTFLAQTMETVFETFEGNEGMWPGYVHSHLLPRLHGFELLMAPYAIAHLKLGLRLKETGYDVDASERLRVYLTNSLEEAHEALQGELLMDFVRVLADEANSASEVKRDLPVMVVLGNPPYSRSSFNSNRWIDELMQDYKTTVRKTESQIQGLSNDYIKFLRWAQWRIDRTGAGVLAMITGHGYLDGPQARDMRRSLLGSFDRLFVLNLHGSTRRSSTLTSSQPDEPVFAIQQGVAILIAVKLSSRRETPEVQYADCIGKIESKFAYLDEHDVTTVDWTPLTPHEPQFYLVPAPDADDPIAAEYESFPGLTDVFGSGDRRRDKEVRWATGFTSQQDQLAISFDEEETRSKVSSLVRSSSKAALRSKFRFCTTNQWDYDRAKRELRTGEWESSIGRCSFRPLDSRTTVFDRNVVTILRKKVMEQLRHPGNFALVTSRVVNDADWSHVFVAREPVDKIFLSSKTSTNAYVFPLLYADNPDKGAQPAASTMPAVIQSNLAASFMALLREHLGYEPTDSPSADDVSAEEAFAYIYAILHSPAYRSRYRAHLRRDFPRIPLTRNPELYAAISALGKRLIGIHLLDITVPTFTAYPVDGSHRVETVVYGPPDESSTRGRISINETQYFEGIPPEVWDFHVGGWRTCEKWLKDRKGRQLTFNDLEHYQRIVAVLSETLRMMTEIDETVVAHGGWPIR